MIVKLQNKNDRILKNLNTDDYNIIVNGINVKISDPATPTPTDRVEVLEDKVGVLEKKPDYANNIAALQAKTDELQASLEATNNKEFSITKKDYDQIVESMRNYFKTVFAPTSLKMIDNIEEDHDMFVMTLRCNSNAATTWSNVELYDNAGNRLYVKHYTNKLTSPTNNAWSYVILTNELIEPTLYEPDIYTLKDGELKGAIYAVNTMTSGDPIDLLLNKSVSYSGVWSWVCVYIYSTDKRPPLGIIKYSCNIATTINIGYGCPPYADDINKGVFQTSAKGVWLIDSEGFNTSRQITSIINYPNFITLNKE